MTISLIELISAVLVPEVFIVLSIDEGTVRDDFVILPIFRTFSTRLTSTDEDSKLERSEMEVSKIISAGSFEVQV